MPTATTSSRIPHAAAEASHVVPDHKSVDRREGQKKPLDSPNNDPKTVSWLRPKSSANAVISCAGSQEQTAAGRSGSAGRLAVAQKRRTRPTMTQRPSVGSGRNPPPTRSFLAPAPKNKLQRVDRAQRAGWQDRKSV